MSGNPVTFSITHEELIEMYQRSERAKNGPCDKQREIQRELENHFCVAIAEASAAGQLAYELLVPLDELVDPVSGNRICPKVHDDSLRDALARASVLEKRLQAQAQGLIPVPAEAGTF